MTANPIFGIVVCILGYEVGLFLSRKLKSPLANPFLLSAIFLGAFLSILKIPKEDFMVGGQFLSFFVAPATVALALPIYRQWEVLKSNFLPIIGGVVLGSCISVVSVIVLSKVFQLDMSNTMSIVPKSVTTPIALEICNENGGYASVTILSLLFTGVFGAVFGPGLLKRIGVEDPVAVGVALGSTSHVVGTTKALELGETQGAMSGLCIGLAGVATVLWVPLWLMILW